MGRSRTDTALLACGIAAALIYAAAHDALAVLLYDGYSAFSQAVSELSSVGAPTRPAALVVEFVSDVLLVAFGVGVWRAALGRRSLRIVAACVIGYGALFPLWLPFPMTARGGGRTPGTTDLMHLVLGVATIVLMLVAIGCGATAFARPFRLYSVGTFVAVLVLWSWSGSYGGRIAADRPTPWLGVVERAALAAWLAWVVVLALVLLREKPRRRGAALHRLRIAGSRTVAASSSRPSDRCPAGRPGPPRTSPSRSARPSATGGRR